MDPQEQLDQAAAEQDADAAFAAGLSDSPTETPAVALEDRQQDSAPAEGATPAPKYRQITEEEWAALESRAAAADTLRATLEKVSGTAFGKIGGIERTLQQLQSSGIGEVSVEDFPKLRDEFPDLAEMLVEGLNEALKKAPRATVDVAELEGKLQATLAERLDAQDLAFRTALVAVRHKDWAEVVKTPEFQAWAAAKPAEFQQQLMGRDSEFVVDALTEFKESRKPTPKPTDPSLRRNRIAAAETPRGSGGTAEQEDPFMAGLRSG